MEKKPSFFYGEHPGKNNGVTMNNVGPELHREVSAEMGDQWMDSPVYQMKQRCQPFFQGGSGGGEWIFIEFWSVPERHREFTEFLLEIFRKHYPDGEVTGLETLL